MSMAAMASRATTHGFVLTNNKRHGRSLTLRSTTQYRLKMLWEATRDPETAHHGWAYKKQVMDAAYELFGSFPSMLSALHMRSLMIQPSHYEFLHDCCRFLNTGGRTMSVAHWNTVLTYEDWPERAFVDDTSRQREERLRAFSKRLSVSHETHGSLVEQWCSQPGGYIDLAYTLKMLFLASAE